MDNKGVHFFQNANNLNFKLCILSPKLTFKSWISHVRKNLYKLSKLGGGGNLDKIQKKAFFYLENVLNDDVDRDDDDDDDDGTTAPFFGD